VDYGYLLNEMIYHVNSHQERVRAVSKCDPHSVATRCSVSGI